jgi:hypothetical protein
LELSKVFLPQNHFQDTILFVFEFGISLPLFHFLNSCTPVLIAVSVSIARYGLLFNLHFSY